MQNRTLLFANTSTIWENADGCAQQYHCANIQHLLSMLAHAYNIIIYDGVGASGYCIDVVDSLNATEKGLLSMFMTTVQLPGVEAYDLHMTIHTSTTNTCISLARGFQNISQT